MKKLCLLIACVLVMTVIPFCSYASEESKENESITFKDYCGIVSDSAKSYINRKNETLFNGTEAKIIFVTIESTGGISAQEYCCNMFAETDMNRLGRNNSVLFVIAPEEEDYGFVQGSNIRLTLTDDMLDKFAVDYFEPDFQKKNYDEAILKTFNALAGWYESKYTDLNLGLDSDINNYTGGTITKDVMEKPSHLLMWAGIVGGITVMIVILAIKRNIDLQIRQYERRKLKKKYKIDIDKIVNS